MAAAALKAIWPVESQDFKPFRGGSHGLIAPVRRFAMAGGAVLITIDTIMQADVDMRKTARP